MLISEDDGIWYEDNNDMLDDDAKEKQSWNIQRYWFQFNDLIDKNEFFARGDVNQYH